MKRNAAATAKNENCMAPHCCAREAIVVTNTSERPRTSWEGSERDQTSHLKTGAAVDWFQIAWYLNETNFLRQLSARNLGMGFRQLPQQSFRLPPKILKSLLRRLTEDDFSPCLPYQAAGRPLLLNPSKTIASTSSDLFVMVHSTAIRVCVVALPE